MPKMHHLFKHAFHWLCLLAALALSACGPGTGGTGTGPQPTATIAPFAATYTNASSAGSVASTGTPSTGTNSATTAAVGLQLQTTGIVLTSACADFNYSGTWSVSATGGISVQGIYTSTTQQAAILSIVFTNANADSASLTLNIQTLSGTLLLGPVILQRSDSVTVAPPKSGC
jgi:hypothetical protein